MTEVSKCILCEHYLKNFKCSAFPKLIPEEIASGKKEHNQVIVGQVGNYIFTKKK